MRMLGHIFRVVVITVFITSLSDVALSQQTGRIFPYQWSGEIPADDITTADVQHALIWTGYYDAMVDGAYGPGSRRAVRGWLLSKGYSGADTLTTGQAVELVGDGLRRRDRFGWATLVDPAIGFSVGVPTKLTSKHQVTRENGYWSYDAYGLFEHHISVLIQPNGCLAMDSFYSAILNLSSPNRQVMYEARKDDWFVVAGQSGDRRFYTRAQCREQGLVSVVTNVPTQRVDELSFLFVALSNSLSLRPTLNVSARPSPRLVFPNPAPGVAASSRQSAPDKPEMVDLIVDRLGKTNRIKLTLSDGSELRPRDVFERASGSIYIVKAGDRMGSAVAISKSDLLTNCHVVRSSSAVLLEREGQSMPAALVSADVEADRCVLRTGREMPQWVKVRPYADIKVGERAFTIGAPRGLELTMAEGLVSSKRTSDGVRFIQTSAPISPGSSGGGLFDTQGYLLGITTFLLKDAQNLNFAIAAEEYAK